MSVLLRRAVCGAAAKVDRLIHQIDDGETGISTEGLREVYELLLVLARIVDGMDVKRAFGAPGDWGYDTPIGDGVIELLNTSPPPAAEARK